MPKPAAPTAALTVYELLMDNLIQLGMRDTDLSPPDGRHTSNGGMVQRIAKSVAADHSGRTHDYQTFLARRRNVHDSSRCSSQST